MLELSPVVLSRFVGYIPMGRAQPNNGVCHFLNFLHHILHPLLAGGLHFSHSGQVIGQLAHHVCELGKAANGPPEYILESVPLFGCALAAGPGQFTHFTFWVY